MGISRCVLFIDTPMGAIEAETEQERESAGIKITLRDEGKEPEIRVQYNYNDRSNKIPELMSKKHQTPVFFAYFLIGSLKKNVAPPPSVSLKPISPSSILASSFAMLNPRPK